MDHFYNFTIFNSRPTYDPMLTCDKENDPWDMLNNFSFHVYGQKSLFIVKNVNALFLTAAPTPYPLTLEFIELVPS